MNEKSEKTKEPSVVVNVDRHQLELISVLLTKAGLEPSAFSKAESFLAALSAAVNTNHKHEWRMRV